MIFIDFPSPTPSPRDATPCALHHRPRTRLKDLRRQMAIFCSQGQGVRLKGNKDGDGLSIYPWVGQIVMYSLYLIYFNF